MNLQEPVCPDCKAKVLYECVACSSNNYPPKRPWQGLTNEEKNSFWKADQMTQKEWDELFAEIEAKIKEKNT